MKAKKLGIKLVREQIVVAMPIKRKKTEIESTWFFP